MFARLKRWFAYGLLIWVPIAVTVFVVRFLLDLFDKLLGFVPAGYRPEHLWGFGIPGLGLLLAIVLLIVTGLLASNLVGRSIVAGLDRLMARIPFVRAIYGGSKQVAATLFAGETKAFRRAALVPFPTRGSYSIGFITSHRLGEVQEKTGAEIVSVFVPTTPNPTSGFILLVPKEDVIELEMTVEEALKMIVSLGVVVPEWPRSERDRLVATPGKL
ncbi:MAG: DUF502 domain-containing protein [Gammaproteobacteria bacterium]